MASNTFLIVTDMYGSHEKILINVDTISSITIESGFTKIQVAKVTYYVKEYIDDVQAAVSELGFFFKEVRSYER